jgi:predicted nucleic acid-binding protein
VLEARVIVDTGPLVALLVEDDAHHDWVVEQLEAMRPPLLCCEPVLTETFHLLRRVRGGPQAFFDLLGRGLLVRGLDLLEQRLPLARLVRRYADRPMSLADACLVRMAELQDGAVVFTLDSDFVVYRMHERRLVPAILPSERRRAR